MWEPRREIIQIRILFRYCEPIGRPFATSKTYAKFYGFEFFSFSDCFRAPANQLPAIGNNQLTIIRLKISEKGTEIRKKYFANSIIFMTSHIPSIEKVLDGKSTGREKYWTLKVLDNPVKYPKYIGGSDILKTHKKHIRGKRYRNQKNI